MAKPVRFNGPIYAIKIVGEWEWWCVWARGKDAGLGKPPDRTGWVRFEPSVTTAIGMIVGVLAGGEVTPGAREASAVAGALTSGDRICRDDGLASIGYVAAGRPKPPGHYVDNPDIAVRAPKAPTARPWWAVELRLALPTNRADVTAAYRARSQVTHPDKGGSAEAFNRTKLAHEAAIGHVAAQEAASRG